MIHLLFSFLIFILSLLNLILFIDPDVLNSHAVIALISVFFTSVHLCISFFDWVVKL